MNLESSPEQAAQEMEATWQNRMRLKRAAGISMRGRDNKTPVLHMTLSWHADDHPTPDHMKETALSALKALGLEEHQVLMAGHEDKHHLHAHLVINTVHPETGRTAPMKYTKERLSRWAEAYEKEHGIRCEQRIENNKERDRLKKLRELNANYILMAAQQRHEPPERIPYAPVKDRSPTRSQWFKTKEMQILLGDRRDERAPDGVPRAGKLPDRHTDVVMIDPNDLGRINSALHERHSSPALEAAKRDLFTKQKRERAVLDEIARKSIAEADRQVSQEFRPRWNRLFRAQARETAYVEGLGGRSILERTAYIAMNRDRLGNDRPLDVRQIAELTRNPDKLMRAVRTRHEHERQALGYQRGKDGQRRADEITRDYQGQVEQLIDRHVREFEKLSKLRPERGIDGRGLSDAQKEMAAELGIETHPPSRPRRRIKRTPEREPTSDNPGLPPEKKALSRSEQIRRDMEEWRRRNSGRDLGREL